jgi:asparagine synthase (glutamine-hydrolysing)
MCGLVGLVDFKNTSNNNIFEDMLETLYHRGPDNSGVEFIQVNNTQIALGHKRLSILDLSTNGHQPFKFQNLTMVYNGEVYNFQEIRKELEDVNYSFSSHSDTEVIIKAYHAWGDSAIDKLNGMFAIAIYDSSINTLKLIRDRAGVKPLYYYRKDDLFMFASELKAFHKHPLFDKKISNDSLAMYLKYGSIPQPNSIFKYVKKIENGHILTFDLISKKIAQQRYWNIYDFYQKDKLDISENEAMKRLDELINSSVKYRMISDVPIGSFLSGGYDSSIITAIMQKNSNTKVKTFTIGFENTKYNEASHARAVTDYLGTEHTEYTCTSKDALEILPKLADILDEPMADTSIIPTLIVSKITKEKVTVSLSADGGDELFAGYDAYRKVADLNKKLNLIPFKSQFGSFLNTINTNSSNQISRKVSRVSSILKAKNIIELYDSFSNTFLDTHIEKLLIKKTAKEFSKLDIYNSPNLTQNNLDALLAKDFQSTHVDQLLVKVDRATMHYSLEGREPLLDYRLIEFAAQLPQNLKLKDGTGKYLLKNLTHKYIPKEIMDRPKMGFSVPIQDWFKNDFKKLVEDYLDKEIIKQQGIFEYKEIEKITNNYFIGKNINFKQLWNLVLFQMWYERWCS